MAQTSYSINMQTARQGQLADSGLHDVVSGTLTVAGGYVGVFGTLAILDETNGDYAIRPPNASTDCTGTTPYLFFGVIVEAQTVPSGTGGTPAQYANGYTVPCLRRGRIWVNGDNGAITPGTSRVYGRYANGNTTTGTIGGFGASSSASDNALLPDSMFRWVTKTTATNQLAQLEVNLP